MKKAMAIPLFGGLCILLAAAGFAGCTSAAQSRADELFPRHEQARLVSAATTQMIELITLDGEDISSMADVMSGAAPGLTPGRHSLEFYLGTWGTKSVRGQTTSSTLYSSGNFSVTTSQTQTNTAATYDRLSDLLRLESDFKPGRAYALVSGQDGEPLIYDAGYSDWYWQWRVETKKPGETLVTIKDGHFQAAQGAWPFVLLIDGEPSLSFSSGGEREIVLPQGPHTFAVMDKMDPSSEAISASRELDIASEEMAIEIRGSGNQFSIVEAEVAEAENAGDAEAAMRREFPLADAGRRPGPGESVLEIKVDLVWGLGLTQSFFLDGKPIANLQNDESIRVIIPNGRHTISIGNPDGFSKEEFTANSNLITAAWEQTLWTSFNIKVKPLN